MVMRMFFSLCTCIDISNCLLLYRSIMSFRSTIMWTENWNISNEYHYSYVIIRIFLQFNFTNWINSSSLTKLKWDNVPWRLHRIQVCNVMHTHEGISSFSFDPWVHTFIMCPFGSTWWLVRAVYMVYGWFWGYFWEDGGNNGFAYDSRTRYPRKRAT